LHPDPPKHQWIVSYLLSDDLGAFRRNVERLAEDASNLSVRHIVLSTEGIFNHWSDFSATARRALGELAVPFDVSVWCVFREPVSFAMSLYCQLLKNAPSPWSPCYGTHLPPEEVANHPWFVKRLDYAGFIEDVERLFGTIVVSRYESTDTLQQARILLGLDQVILPNVAPRNRSLSALGADLMARLNRLALDTEERQKMVAQILDIENRLGRTSEPLAASEAMTRRVMELSGASVRYLASRFGIAWPERPRPGGLS
jgi:hypothetical protein